MTIHGPMLRVSGTPPVTMMFSDEPAPPLPLFTIAPPRVPSCPELVPRAVGSEVLRDIQGRAVRGIARQAGEDEGRALGRLACVVTAVGSAERVRAGIEGDSSQLFRGNHARPPVVVDRTAVERDRDGVSHAVRQIGGGRRKRDRGGRGVDQLEGRVIEGDRGRTGNPPAIDQLRGVAVDQGRAGVVVDPLHGEGGGVPDRAKLMPPVMLAARERAAASWLMTSVLAVALVTVPPEPGVPKLEKSEKNTPVVSTVPLRSSVAPWPMKTGDPGNRVLLPPFRMTVPEFIVRLPIKYSCAPRVRFPAPDLVRGPPMIELLIVKVVAFPRRIDNQVGGGGGPYARAQITTADRCWHSPCWRAGRRWKW